MRQRLRFICLNRLGQKKGNIILSTDEKELNTKEIFERNRIAIKNLYPDAVKIKLDKK